ncbi:MAG: Hsp33 family molecular chaperone HslO [Candidatus Izemoplasmatales bacterium]|nr:Hsp33 family molecular chaperone HslO [Candidatus Izemoplasmatales bacterium]
MNDYLVKAYAFAQTVRIYGARTTDLTEHARTIHDCWPSAAAALGRSLTASVIMGAMYKGDQELTIQIDGGGPIGKILIYANANGQVKGTLTQPHVHLSSHDGKLDVGSTVGHQGYIHVTKDLKIRNTFTSSAELQTGEIGDDFTHYFAMSEQIPSAVGLGVKVSTDGKIVASGGFILQVMPGAKPDTIPLIEERIRKMKPVSTLIEEGKTPEEIIEAITQGDHVWAERLDLSYHCDCSKDRFAKGLVTLGHDELESMIIENKPIETTCQFCGKVYHFSPEELEDLHQTMTQKTLGHDA